jgi:hypothetical protein
MVYAVGLRAGLNRGVSRPDFAMSDLVPTIMKRSEELSWNSFAKLIQLSTDSADSPSGME